MRDHMMGWAIPAEPLGPAIQPKKSYTKAEVAEAKRQIEFVMFEQRDHMLPGMKKSDFPKEYDTRAAIKDRADEAYNRALRELLPPAWLTGDFGFDPGAPGGGSYIDEWAGMPKNWEFYPEPKTASGLQMLMAASRKKFGW